MSALLDILIPSKALRWGRLDRQAVCAGQHHGHVFGSHVLHGTDRCIDCGLDPWEDPS